MPACTVMVRSSGSYSITASRRGRSRTRSTAAEGCRARGRFRGRAARPRVALARRAPAGGSAGRPTLGATTQRGSTPSMAAAARAPASSRRARARRSRRAPRRPSATRRTSRPSRSRCRRAARGRAGRNPSPQAGCEGRSLPGFMILSGSNARRSRYMKFRSASPYCSGRLCALSRPTPCSPVTLPPRRDAGAQQLLVGRLRALELVRDAIVVAGSSGGGCRRRRGRRWRSARGGARRWRCISRMIAGSFERGTTASCSR